MTEPKQPEALPTPEGKPAIEEPGPAPAPEKLRLDPTRYGDWELNGKCVDFQQVASRPETAALILEYAQNAGSVSTRRMFGEYALYCDGRTVALICDDELYVKPTKAGKSYLGEPTEGTPFPGAKHWFLIPGDQWEDADWLAQLLRLTAAELPLPKPKKKKSR